MRQYHYNKIYWLLLVYTAVEGSMQLDEKTFYAANDCETASSKHLVYSQKERFR